MTEGHPAENDAAELRAHVEYLSEVIDVLRWTVADLLTSNAEQSYAAQLRRLDDAYRATRVIPPAMTDEETK